jgi:hypothetical protein
LRRPEPAAYSHEFKIAFGIVFSCITFLFMSLLSMLLVGCMLMFKKYRGVLGEHELEVRADGLVERTDVNESLHRWAGFHKIVSTGRYLYIYVTDVNVHIVPRRCFGSEQEEHGFRGELEKHIRAVQPGR